MAGKGEDDEGRGKSGPGVRVVHMSMYLIRCGLQGLHFKGSVSHYSLSWPLKLSPK